MCYSSVLTYEAITNCVLLLEGHHNVGGRLVEWSSYIMCSKLPGGHTSECLPPAPNTLAPALAFHESHLSPSMKFAAFYGLLTIHHQLHKNLPLDYHSHYFLLIMCGTSVGITAYRYDYSYSSTFRMAVLVMKNCLQLQFLLDLV